MNRVVKIVLFMGFWLSGVAMAAPAGVFSEVVGDVTMTPAGKAPVKVKTGDSFESGARMVTGPQGHANLKFEDGELMALAVNTDFTVTNYRYVPSAPAEGSVIVNLARGGLRFVTGLIGKANPSQFAVRTPTVTAGVRGSDGIVIINPNGGSVLVGSNGDKVTVTGADGVTVTLDAGTFSYSTGPNASPVTFTAATAPAGIAALLDSAFSLIQTKLDTAVANQSAAAAPLQNAQSQVSGAGGGGGGTPTSGTSP